MPRYAHTYGEYVALGKSKGLDYMETEGFTPKNSRTPVKWRCNLTGHVFTKAYQRVKDAPFGTRYQRDFAMNLARYYALADALGIEFPYNASTDKFPRNTKTKTVWEGKDGKQVMASFHELAYDIIPDRLLRDLGLSRSSYNPENIKSRLEAVNA